MIDFPTICGFCSCGCALYVEPTKGRINALCPSANHPVSTGRLCIKGWNATPALVNEQRLRTPLVRKQGKLEPASWEEAISATVSALKQTEPAKIGVIGSAKTTNEECYQLARLARDVIGTPNVDSACRFYDASLIPALLDTTGVPGSQVTLDAVSQAGSMLIVGANVMEQLAHVGSRIQDAVENGCKVVAVDPRTSRLAPQATIFLHPKPGTDLAWLRVMAKTIIDKQLYAEGVPEMPGFEELRASLEGADAARLEAECGLTADAVTEAAQMLAANPPCIVMFGLGVMQQAESTRTIKALADIALLLGGKVMPLRGQNNAQGACDMGLLPDMLPGYTAAPKPGIDAARMLRECETLLIFGENVALSAPDTGQTTASLERMKFVAVADIYLTETAQLADVVFPACSFLEKDGTFTNIERRVQRVRKVLDPPGEALSDLQIVAALAAGLGSNLSANPAEVMGEIAANVPAYSRVSYERLDETWGSPWIVENATARLAPLPAPEPVPASDLPMRLIAARINFHQQTGTMAWRTPILAREYPNCVAELNEADANALKLRPGAMITISSATASLTRRLALSDAVPKGCVHVPHFAGGDSPNALVSYQPDSISGVPAYKACAVKVEAAG